MRDNMRDDPIQILHPCHHETAAAGTSMETYSGWGNVVGYLILWVSPPPRDLNFLGGGVFLDPS
jgi:hypothetical protein